ncbi:hypothetical protein EUX98_g8677 [Antrodiella citrinella]|uniref:Uncharacterized protein n=1 Tax=Antrodiella citrinella TaxID=2447956 RepID=A0A4S4M617_9APHY|nr:hypothetical protein EUX98_g8677 [Antrodiella citrinella]
MSQSSTVRVRHAGTAYGQHGSEIVVAINATHFPPPPSYHPWSSLSDLPLARSDLTTRKYLNNDYFYLAFTSLNPFPPDDKYLRYFSQSASHLPIEMHTTPSGPRYRLALNVQQKWYSLETLLRQSIIILEPYLFRERGRFPIVVDPSSFGYRKDHANTNLAHQAATVSRDAMSGMMAYLSMQLACCRTMPPPQQLHDWRDALLKGTHLDWSNWVRTSAVISGSSPNTRRGGFVYPYDTRPAVHPVWSKFIPAFNFMNIPLWFSYGSFRDNILSKILVPVPYALTTQDCRLLKLTLDATAESAPPVLYDPTAPAAAAPFDTSLYPEPLTGSGQRRGDTNVLQRKAHFDGPKGQVMPSIRSTAQIFVWQKHEGDPPCRLRTKIDKKCWADEWDDRNGQRIYDAFSNTWDISSDFGPDEDRWEDDDDMEFGDPVEEVDKAMDVDENVQETVAQEVPMDIDSDDALTSQVHPARSSSAAFSMAPSQSSTSARPSPALPVLPKRPDTYIPPARPLPTPPTPLPTPPTPLPITPTAAVRSNVSAPPVASRSGPPPSVASRSGPTPPVASNKVGTPAVSSSSEVPRPVTLRTVPPPSVASRSDPTPPVASNKVGTPAVSSSSEVPRPVTLRTVPPPSVASSSHSESPVGSGRVPILLFEPTSAQTPAVSPAATSFSRILHPSPPPLVLSLPPSPATLVPLAPPRVPSQPPVTLLPVQAPSAQDTPPLPPPPPAPAAAPIDFETLVNMFVSATEPVISLTWSNPNTLDDILHHHYGLDAGYPLLETMAATLPAPEPGKHLSKYHPLIALGWHFELTDKTTLRRLATGGQPATRIYRRRYSPSQSNELDRRSGDCFVVSDKPDAPFPWTLVINDPIIALHILRRWRDLATEDIVKRLNSQGMPFVLYKRREDFFAPPIAGKSHDLYRHRRNVTHGYVPQGRMPSVKEYRRYMSDLKLFFSSSYRLRAAAQHGGLIWRIASEFIDEDNDVRVTGLDDDSLEDGALPQSWQNGVELWQEGLSTEEVHYICGVYLDDRAEHQTPKHVSWWPKPGMWDSSGLFTHYWTPACERWYQKRITALDEGKAKAMHYAEWRPHLKFSRGILTEMEEVNKDLANALLQELVP